MQGNSSSQLYSKINSRNPLAEFAHVVCPACGTESSIGRKGEWICGGHNCGQKLDADAHKSEVIRERWQIALRPIGAKRARAFILDFVNMRGDVDDLSGVGRLLKRFAEFFPPPFPGDSYTARAPELAGLHSPAELRNLALGQLIGCRNHLRYAWSAGKENREWTMHFVRKMAAGITAHPTLTPGVLEKRLDLTPPPRDAFQQALLYFHSRAHLARRCANPGCKILPYYFADKPNQKYCSETCFHVVRDEAQRQWWTNHGAEWREKRKKAIKKKGAKHAKR